MDKEIRDAVMRDVERLAEFHGADVVVAVLTALKSLSHVKESHPSVQRSGGVTHRETIYLGNADVEVEGNAWEGKLVITVTLPRGSENA